MKAGLTIEALATEIMRQKDARKMESDESNNCLVTTIHQKNTLF